MEESINLILLGGIDDIRKHGGGIVPLSRLSNPCFPRDSRKNLNLLLRNSSS